MVGVEERITDHGTAKPMTSIVPFRTAVAGIATSANRNASPSQLTPHGAGTSLSGTRREVPLPSEEGTKGVVQYALYVFSHLEIHGK